jgi:hypothetical protein
MSALPTRDPATILRELSDLAEAILADWPLEKRDSTRRVC